MRLRRVFPAAERTLVDDGFKSSRTTRIDIVSSTSDSAVTRHAVGPADVGQIIDLMARPERLELPTPWFEVASACCGTR